MGIWTNLGPRLAAMVFLFATVLLSSCSERQPKIVGGEDKQPAPGAGATDSASCLEGKVSCNGKPLDGGVVKIWQGGLVGVGWIQADGAYRVEHLPEGKVKIALAAEYIVPKNLEQRKLRKASRDPDSSDLPPHMRSRIKAVAQAQDPGTAAPVLTEGKRASPSPETANLLEALQQKYGSPVSSNVEVKLRRGSNSFNIELNTN